VILFGSHRHGFFILDTVFVVANSMKYHRNEVASLPVPDAYRLAGLEPLAGGCGRGEEFVLYEGATPSEPTENMFSFFPCKLAEVSTGFPRPTVTLPGVINAALKQGLKSQMALTLSAVRKQRGIVVQIVLVAGLLLGTAAEMPSPTG
jgi:hypothetical protein